MPEKYMKVQRIEHGTVIDHILPGMAFDVLRVLGMSNDRA
jgi:aspartate carbamoyltransferase regulatory subunit